MTNHQYTEYDPKDSLITSGPFSPTALANGNHLNNQSSSSEGFSNGFRGRGRGGDRGRGRGRGRGGSERGGFHKSNRAEFSSAGPNHDRSISRIVVEQIPEEKFAEEAVREFFAEFGVIEEVTLQPYKRLAIVKYSDYTSARAAYDSPKVIFDNRFVKVYWYKPGSLPTPSPGTSTLSATANNNDNDTIMQEVSPPIDMEAFTASATAAQAKLDAKKAALAASQSQRAALEKQKADLAIKQAAENQKLLDRLVAKGVLPDDTSKIRTSAASSQPTPSTTNNNSTEIRDNNTATTSKVGDSAHTLMLRAKVAELEAEAKSLGLPDSALVADPSAFPFSPRGQGRGRGRGRSTRGSYRGWEAFDSSYRGGSGGGSPFVPARGGGSGKYNLDLRTKRVAVALPTTASTSSSTGGGEIFDGSQGRTRRWTAEQDEALRQHLLGVGEFDDIVPLSPSLETDKGKEASGKDDDNMTDSGSGGAETLVVIFKDRGTAERFLYGLKDKEVPGLGQVAVSWFNGPPLRPAGGSKDMKREDVDGDAGVDMDDLMDNNNDNINNNGVEQGRKYDGKARGNDHVGESAGVNVNGNGNGDGAVPLPPAELRSGSGPGDISGGLGGEGDYDVAEEDDDSWMT